MNKVIKKLVSVICALAMVVSSLTYYPAQEVKAAVPAESDWESIAYVENGTGNADYTNKYKFYCSTATLVNIQQPAWAEKPGIFFHFPNGISSCSLQQGTYKIDGAGIIVYPDDFSAKVTAFNVVIGNTDHYCYLYNADGESKATLNFALNYTVKEDNTIDVNWRHPDIEYQKEKYYLNRADDVILDNDHLARNGAAGWTWTINQENEIRTAIDGVSRCHGNSVGIDTTKGDGNYVVTVQYYDADGNLVAQGQTGVIDIKKIIIENTELNFRQTAVADTTKNDSFHRFAWDLIAGAVRYVIEAKEDGQSLKNPPWEFNESQHELGYWCQDVKGSSAGETYEVVITAYNSNNEVIATETIPGVEKYYKPPETPDIRPEENYIEKVDTSSWEKLDYKYGYGERTYYINASHGLDITTWFGIYAPHTKARWHKESCIIAEGKSSFIFKVPETLIAKNIWINGTAYDNHSEAFNKEYDALEIATDALEIGENVITYVCTDNSKVTFAIKVEEPAPFDPTAVEWSNVTGSSDIQYYIATDEARVTEKPEVRGDNIHIAYAMAAVFSSVKLDETILTPDGGAITNIPLNLFESGIHKLFVLNAYGNEVAIIYFKVADAKTKLTTPTNLNASIVSTNVNVTFDAVEHATGYELYINGVRYEGDVTTNNTFAISGLEPGTYTYKVKAIDSSDAYAESDFTNDVSVVIPPVPNAPTEIAYADGSLTWTGTTDVTYNAYVKKAGENEYTELGTGLETNTCTVSDDIFSTNGVYTFAVEASNVKGTSDKATFPYTYVTDASSVTAQSLTKNTITGTITAADGQSDCKYNVYLGAEKKLTNVDAGTFTIENVAAGTYTVTVKTVINDVESNGVPVNGIIVKDLITYTTGQDSAATRIFDVVEGAKDYTRYNGISISSSDGNSANANKALDEKYDATDRWLSSTTEETPYITLDLGKKYNITDIQIIWRNAAGTYDVKFSDNGTDFTDICSGENSKSNRLDHIAFDDAKSAKYVRIYCKSKAPNFTSGYEIIELKVYGPDEQGVALSAPTNLNKNFEEGNVNITFDSVEHATSYELYVNGVYSETIETAVKSYPINELDPGTYKYKVKALDTNGEYLESDFSIELDVIIPSAPLEPTSIVYKEGTLNWVGESGNTYSVYLTTPDNSEPTLLQDGLSTTTYNVSSELFTNIGEYTFYVEATNVKGTSRGNVKYTYITEAQDVVATSTRKNTIDVTITATQEQIENQCKYNVYVDGVLQLEDKNAGTYEIPNVKGGTHTVTVKTVYKSNESNGNSVSNIEVKDLITYTTGQNSEATRKFDVIEGVFDYTDYFGVTASSSSNENNTLVADKAIDNSMKDASRWASVAKVDNQYLTIDLGKKYNISDIQIIWQNSAAKTYDVMISNNGDDFTKVCSGEYSTGNRLDHISFDENQVARYVRILGTTRTNSNNGYSIMEIAIYGPDEQGTQLAKPESLTAEISGTNVNVTFNAVSNATGYELYVNGEYTETITGTSKEYAIGDLAAGTYTYRVKAIDSTGSYIESVMSDETQIVIPSIPGTPQGLEYNAETSVLQWTKVQDLTYRVYAKGPNDQEEHLLDSVSNNSFNVNSELFTDLGAYTFYVEAVNVKGISETKASTTYYYVTAPASVTAEKSGDTTIAGTITAASNHDENCKYNIYLDGTINKTVLTAGDFVIEDVQTGIHSVTVKTVYEGHESEGITISNLNFAASIVIEHKDPGTLPSYEGLNDYTDFEGVLVSASNEKQPAKNAIDNKGGTRWETTESDAHYITIDLQNIYNVNKFAIWWEGASASSYNIDVSTDGVNYTTVTNVLYETANNSRNDIITLANSVEARYVRFDCLARKTQYGYSIYELAIYGPDNMHVNAPTNVTYNEALGRLSWTGNTGNKYRVYVKKPGEDELVKIADDLSRTSYYVNMDMFTADREDYEFYIEAFNEYGNSEKTVYTYTYNVPPVPTVKDLTARGDFDKLVVDWTNNEDHTTGYTYKIYLDDSEEPVASASSSPVRVDASIGLHKVTVVAEYGGRVSEPATVDKEPISYVYKSPATVPGLVATSTIEQPKVVNVNWNIQNPDAKYEVRIVSTTDETINAASSKDLITGSYTFNNISSGDYTVSVIERVYNRKSNVTKEYTTVYETPVHVYDTIADPPTNITFDPITRKITWRKSPNGLTYKIYIMGPEGVVTTAKTADDKLIKSDLTLSGTIFDQVEQGEYILTEADYQFTTPGLYLIKMTAVNDTGESTTTNYKIYDHTVKNVDVVYAEVVDDEDDTNNADSVKVTWVDNNNNIKDITYDIYVWNADHTKTYVTSVTGVTETTLTNIPAGVHNVQVVATYSYEQKVYDTNRDNNIDYQRHSYRSDYVESPKFKIYGNATVEEIKVTNNTGGMKITWYKQTKEVTDAGGTRNVIDRDATYVVEVLNDKGVAVYTSSEPITVAEDDILDTLSVDVSSLKTGNYTVNVIATINDKSVKSVLEDVFVYPYPEALNASDISLVDDDSMAKTLVVQIDPAAMKPYTTYTAVLYTVDENGVETPTDFKSSANSKGSIVIKNVTPGPYKMKIFSSINGISEEYIHADEIEIEHIVFPSKLIASSNNDNAIGVGWTIGQSSEYIGCTYTVNVYAATDTAHTTVIKSVQTAPGATNTIVSGLDAGEYLVGATVTDKENHTSKEVYCDTVVKAYDPIEAPQNIEATRTDVANQMQFTFDKVSGAVAYQFDIYNKDGSKLEKDTAYVVDALSPNYTETAVQYKVNNLVSGKYYVAVIAVREDGRTSNVNASEYVEIHGAAVSEVNSLTITGDYEVKTIKWTTSPVPEEGQYFRVYVDDVKVGTVEAVNGVYKMEYTYTFTEAGYHTIRVTSVHGEEGNISFTESEGYSKSVNVQFKDDTAKLDGDNHDLKVIGFQINTSDKLKDENGQISVNIRVVCKAPKIGETITFTEDNKTYTGEVIEMGTIYGLDQNGTGIKRFDMLDNSYMRVNSEYDAANMRYTGSKSNKFTYNNGENIINKYMRAYGYPATEKGMLNYWDPNDTKHSYYSCTMQNMAIFVANDIHVRPYVRVTVNGEEHMVYGTQSAAASIAQIADHLYKNSKSANANSHEYLYNYILSSKYLRSEYVYFKYQQRYGDNNVYYRTTAISYGWNGYLYTPGDTEQEKVHIIKEGTLDDLNEKARLEKELNQANADGQ